MILVFSYNDGVVEAGGSREVLTYVLVKLSIIDAYFQILCSIFF